MAQRDASFGMSVALGPMNGGQILDLVYLGLTVGFFAVSLALVELLDRL